MTTEQELRELKEELEELNKRKPFLLSLEPKDSLVFYLTFTDNNAQYTLEHPGALTAIRVVNQGSEASLEFFIQKVIRPKPGVENNPAKKLTPENLDITEAFEFWHPFAWRFLRFRENLALAANLRSDDNSKDSESDGA